MKWSRLAFGFLVAGRLVLVGSGIGWVDVATGLASPLSATNAATQGFFRIKAE